MALPLLGTVNRAATATLSGGSFLAAWPRANMQDIVLSRVAVSADATEASNTVRADLGQAYPIRFAAITLHTATAAAAIALRFAASEAGLASATPIVQAVWLGADTPAGTAMHVPCALVILPAAASWRWWDVRLVDPANPAGRIEWGYLQLWEALELPRGPGFGQALAPETGTIRQETIGLVAKFDRRRSRRTTRFSIDGLPAATADRLLDLVRDRDLDQPLFWIPDADPDDPARLLRRAFLARMRTLTALEQPYTDYERAGFDLEEIVGG